MANDPGPERRGGRIVGVLALIAVAALAGMTPVGQAAWWRESNTTNAKMRRLGVGR